MPDPAPIPAATNQLGYEQVPLRSRAPRWVLAVAGSYLVCLIGLLTLASYLLLQEERSTILVGLGTLLVLLTSWAAMLLVPVRVASRRPVSRRSIWVPLIASGFFFALLLTGTVLAVGEVFNGDGDVLGWTVLGVASSGWAAWAVVFWIIARGTAPEAIGTWLARSLIAGSVLELLVAVPSHVYVRRRSECCAGVATGTGICIGVTVMFLAFGPGVVMLYLKRVRQISNR